MVSGEQIVQKKIACLHKTAAAAVKAFRGARRRLRSIQAIPLHGSIYAH